MPETPTVRAATGADLRLAILDATRHLLVADGYANLSMRKIAAVVRCSPTSIYLHFDGKDALVHALIAEGMDHLFEALQAGDPGGDPITRLEALSRAYVAFGLRHREQYEVMFQLHPKRMERFPAEDYRRARRNLDLFEDILQAGAEAGVLDATPTAEVAARVLWTALHGLVSLRLAQRIDVRLDDDEFTKAAVARAVRAFRR
ncbi:MAG: TetR/AcrR family transcriptional regulator [Bacteroidota bacterium]